jgi:hypothetical protein
MEKVHKVRHQSLMPHQHFASAGLRPATPDMASVHIPL